MTRSTTSYDAIVIGTSAGGLDALARILPDIKKNIQAPILVVQHISATSDSYLVEYLDKMTHLKVKEAEDKEPIQNGVVYFAPPDYHLLIEDDRSISLSNSEKVNYSRPSIDVLFDSASWVYQSRLVGVIMTGANWDGAQGLKTIRDAGGFSIVEDPKSAAVPRMPESAIALSKPDAVAALAQIPQLINKLF